MLFSKRNSNILLLLALAAGLAITSPQAKADQPVPPEIISAIKAFNTDTADQRKAAYDLIGQKGDARLIPAITAYRDGLLQLQDNRLEMFGPRVDVSGKGSVLPLIDAITGDPIKGPDGTPVYFAKISLTNAIKAPPRSERPALLDLISTLSLLDPDPLARIASIRDAGDRASRVFIESEDQDRFISQMRQGRTALAAIDLKTHPDIATEVTNALSAIDAALAVKKTSLVSAIPDADTTSAVSTAINALHAKIDGSKTVVDDSVIASVNDIINSSRDFADRLDTQQKAIDELPLYRVALHRQLDSKPDKQFVPVLTEACAEIDAVLGTADEQRNAIATLGSIGTSHADNLLQRCADAAKQWKDPSLTQAAQTALAKADRYQTEIGFLQNTFAGLSSGSILVLLALGLSIIFGLMGVINMAHGEFMMIGAFATYLVSEGFKHLPPGAYDWYPLAAIPAAFLAAAIGGYLCEILVIRHLYGRPLETLLATWGLSLVLIQTARYLFGDTLSVKSPSWMEGAVEVMPDLVLPLNRIFIIIYCALAIAMVYLVVNKTPLGLLLRATTQNRDMASALGVATRRVDGFTFAFGAGLAGLAGVAVPLYNKINPGVGQEYIVDSFMVVVVGGVGKLAGAIIAGLGLGFIDKYLEPVLSSFKSIESGASVYAKVIVLALIVLFLQWKPAGLFPPKGRVADA